MLGANGQKDIYRGIYAKWRASTEIDGTPASRGGGRVRRVVLGDMSTPLELFARARDRRGKLAYEVRVCSERPVVATPALKLQVPHKLSALRQADTVVVPGLEHIERIPERPLLNALLGTSPQAYRRAFRAA